MLKRPSPSLGDRITAAVETITRLLMPARPPGRPVSGPVVFRHYL